MSNWPLFREFTGSLTNAGTPTEVVLNFGTSRTPVELSAVSVDMVTGSAATFAPLIGTVAGFQPGTIQERWSATNTNTNLKSDNFNLNRLMNTDANGNLYFRPNPNTGSNNSFDYMIVFRPY